jgi:adenosylcobinamide-phosphate synthase
VEPLISLGILCGALIVDEAVGEWPAAVHPVVWMGKMVALLERASPAAGALRQLAAGVAIAAIVPATFALVSGALLAPLRSQPLLEVAAGVFLLKSTFALRELGLAAARIARALELERVDDARIGLRSLCSRDPSLLEPRALVAATIESVAENASDSFVAPLFYYALLGVPGAMAYRAVNTLDAMIGYHGRYEYLGKASARLDDVLNWIPARITALLIVAAGWLAGLQPRRGWLVWQRDAATTESPNAGRPMAAMAGLLGVELEKEGHYRLGDAVEPLSIAKIADARRVLRVAAILTVAMTTIWIGGWHVRIR